PTAFPDQVGFSAIPSAGPYYVASTTYEGIVLKLNPNYRGSRPHHFREIDFLTGFDVKSVENGRADLFAPYPADLPQLFARFGPGSRAATNNAQRLFVYPLQTVWFLALNTSRAAFHNAQVRRAVNYAVDRDALASQGLFGGQRMSPPTDHLIPDAFPGSARTR